jgi:maltose alpha-D-glucosyltransferase/alpha-amylase
LTRHGRALAQERDRLHHRFGIVHRRKRGRHRRLSRAGREVGLPNGIERQLHWPQPFFPSPLRDHGYDISDYYSIDPRHGTLGDFVEFSQAARDRGTRVIAGLVVNHTSIDSPWFQEARRDKRSKYWNWCVWSKDKPANAEQGMVFPGVQKTTWTFDEQAGEYYYHRFYDHQPDLNTGNPEVRAEIARIIKTWVQLGVCGFRVDALPFIITTKGPASTAFGDCPEYLVELRQVLSWQRGDAVFMGEANLPPHQVPMYFGEGDRVHVIFNFYESAPVAGARPPGSQTHSWRLCRPA